MNRRKRQRSREGGSILVLSLVILFVVAGFTAALLTIATSSRATAQVNEKKLTARGLAEGAVENGKQWLQTNWANQQGSAISTLSKSTPLDLENPAAWSHVTIDGNDARWALMSVIPTLSPAPNAGSHANMTTDGEGWWVDGADGVRTMHYLYAVQGRAEFTPKQNAGDSKSIVGAMSRVVEAQLTPLFQFAVFYNSDLEIQPGPDMTLTGRVHSNRDMFLGCGGTLKMDTDYVRAVGKIYRKRKDDGTPSTGTVLVKNFANMLDANPANDFQFKLPNGTTSASKMFSKVEMAALGMTTPYGFDAGFGGFDVNGNGSLGDASDWKPWGTQAMSFWGGTVQSSDMDVAKAEVPSQGVTIDPYTPKTGGDFNEVPAGSGNFVAVPPGTGTYTKGFYNSKAGLSLKDTSLFAPDGTNVTSALLAGTITTVSIYDAREGKMVPQTKIDVGLLKQSLAQTGTGSALAKMKASWNGLVYATKSSATASAPKGILLANGSELPNNPLTNAATGMTVATNLPIYIQGDYNTKVNGVASATNDPAFHKPAAVIADAVNLLSNAWNNSKTATSTLPTASATTYNTAMIAGNTDSVPGTIYSGGLENLPRFHENWTGKNATIAGSFVNLWKSKIAKSPWVYGAPIYTAPNRLWDFDPNYKDYTKLPPFTPLAVQMHDVVTQ